MSIDLRPEDFIIDTLEFDKAYYAPYIEEGLYAEVDFRVELTDSGIEKLLSFLRYDYFNMDENMTVDDIESVCITFFVNDFDIVSIDVDSIMVYFNGDSDYCPVNSSTMLSVENKVYAKFGGKKNFDRYILDNI